MKSAGAIIRAYIMYKPYVIFVAVRRSASASSA